MDSDDEAILQAEEETRNTLQRKSFTRRYKGSFPVRLYEREEQIFVGSMKPVEPGSSGDGMRIPLGRYDPITGHGVTYRLLRFFQAIEGFHVGYLDLAGRHERRYASLEKRFLAFEEDVGKMLEHISRWYGHDGGEDALIAKSQPSGGPEQTIENLQNRWQIELPWAFGLSACLERLLETMRRHPAPKFQHLCLLNLPMELLSAIFEETDSASARCLGATCRLLRTVGFPYIYKSRGLFMPTFSSEEPRAGSVITAESAETVAFRAREDMLQHAGFLLSHPEITDRIEDFTVAIWDDIETSLESQEPSDQDAFFEPILETVEDLLGRTPNLRMLTIGHMPVSQRLQDTINTLPKLRTLQLTGCRVEENVTTHLCTVPNLALFVTGLGPDEWMYIPSMPSLRTLALNPRIDASHILPPHSVTRHRNPFLTLERVYIAMFPWESDHLVTLIAEAALASAGRGLRLTHLKLALAFGGLGETDIAELLSALEGCPMQYFVLEGILDAPPALIDRIAGTFPHLLSLTLKYRSSDRPDRSRMATWPAQPWEYATRFTKFDRLTHFGWNIDVPPYPDASIMHQFEDGFSPELLIDDPEEGSNACEAVARLFASHCPSMQTMVFVSGNWPRLTYRFGTQLGKRAVLGCSRFFGSAYVDHDPPELSSWPFLGRREESDSNEIQ